MNSTGPSFASRRWLVPVLTLAVCAVVLAGILSMRFWVHRNIHVPLQQRATEMTTKLKAGGASVAEPQVGDDVELVEQVVTLDINGKQIRLLELDASKPGAAKELERIRKEHVTQLLGAAQPAEEEGTLVIVDFDKHPDKAKILDAFHKKFAPQGN